MSESLDPQIVEAIRSGEPGAFAKLVRKYQGAVHGYAYHLTQDASAAEEITQETFLEAHLHLNNLRDSGKLRSWLRSLTYHHSMNWFRHHREMAPLMDVLPTDQPSSTTILEQRETQEALESVLRGLSEPHRVVITLKYMEGLRNSQIAEFLDLPQSTVDVRLHRALRQLRERMLQALERGYRKLEPSFVGIMCRQIQSYRPLIGVGLNLASHDTLSGCGCVAELMKLTEQTQGVYRHIGEREHAVLYGLEQLREDDAGRALAVAREMEQHPCPRGTPRLSVRRVMHRGGEPDCSILLDLARFAHITVGASVAWLLRYDFEFEQVTHPTPCYRLRSQSVHGTKHGLEGRQAELTQLIDVVRYVSVGGSAIRRIVGEAGIGKTHLVQALRERHGDGTCLWLRGKALSNQPYHPIREAIQSHFQFDCVGMLEEHLRAVELEEALPFFADFLRLPDLPADARFQQLTAEQIHYRTLQYLRDWLVLMTDLSPIVWVVEDIHWLDEASSQFLQYLCQTVENCPVLFLLTRRTGYEELPEATHGMALEAHIAERYAEFEECMHLEPLSSMSSHQLLEHWLGDRKLLASDSDRLLERAKGNPLHLRELAQFTHQQRDTEQLPPSLEHLILAHLDRMPPNLQAMLRYAAVSGNSVPSKLVRSAFPDMDVEATRRQLVERGWFEPGSSTSGFTRWHHDLYRETVYRHIAPQARRLLHAEIASQLETIERTTPDVLADHYEAAEMREQAARHAYRAAQMYDAQWQFGRVQHYAALALQHVAPLSQEQRFEVSRLCAWACMQTGHPLEAIPYWKQAEVWSTTNDQRILVDMGLSHCYYEQVNEHQRTNRDEAIYHRERMLARIGPSTDATVMKFACQFCVCAERMPFPEGLCRVLSLIRENNMTETEIWALDALARAHAADGNITEALRLCAQANQLARAYGDNGILTAAELSWAEILRGVGRRTEALAHAQKAERLLGDAHGTAVVNVLYFLGRLNYELGYYDAMIAAFERVVAQEGIVDVRQANTAAVAGLAIGYAHCGEWGNAYRCFWRMLDRTRKQPFSAFVPIIEDAVGSICHGDKPHGRWMYEGIPETMARAQTLIAGLYERGITPQEMIRLELMHSILLAAYVQYGIEHPECGMQTECGVGSAECGTPSAGVSHSPISMVRQFAEHVFSLDEHVGYWEYLVERFESGILEAAIQCASERADGHVRSVLDWLLATVLERNGHEEAGKHLARLGFIPEPCWMLTGPFDGQRLTEEQEQQLLEAVRSAELEVGRTECGVRSAECGVRSAEFGVRNIQGCCSAFRIQHSAFPTPASDFLDAYIDCCSIFQTGERVCAYAATVIESPIQQSVPFLIGYDDNASVWLNGKLVFETDGGSPVILDNERFCATLREGRNDLLVRVANHQPGWGFILRVTAKVVQSTRLKS